MLRGVVAVRFRVLAAVWSATAVWTLWWGCGERPWWWLALWAAVAIACGLAAIIGRDTWIRAGLVVLNTTLATSIVVEASEVSRGWLLLGLEAAVFVSIGVLLCSPLRPLPRPG